MNDQRVAGPRSGLSLRRGFSWNLVGTTVYNLVQWLLVVVLARLATSDVVGKFALMLAICAPVFLTLGLNLRVAYATDAAREWRLAEYLRLRVIMSAVAVVFSAVLGVAFGLRGLDLLALGWVAVAKAVEARGQTMYGYMQLRERLDMVAKSLLLRATLGPILFVAGLLAGNELWIACLGLAVGWWLAQILWDRVQTARLVTDDTVERGRVEWSGSRLWGLGRRTAPLGLDAGVSSLTINTPRYTLQVLEGAATLGRFVALAYLAQTIGMVTGTLADGVVTRLAHYRNQGRRRAFIRLLVKLSAFGFAVGMIVILLGLVLGEWGIRFLLGDEYVDQPLLIALLVSVTVTTVLRSVSRGLQAAQRFAQILYIDLVVLGVTVACCLWLIPEYGSLGAAFALTVAMSVGLALAVWRVAIVLREPSQK